MKLPKMLRKKVKSEIELMTENARAAGLTVTETTMKIGGVQERSKANRAKISAMKGMLDRVFSDEEIDAAFLCIMELAQTSGINLAAAPRQLLANIERENRE